MEEEPDTTNVVYLDESRKARWLKQVEDARRLGGVATFNFEYDDLADVIPFPRKPDDTPDGAA
jgi:hypothetical protein